MDDVVFNIDIINDDVIHQLMDSRQLCEDLCHLVVVEIEDIYHKGALRLDYL